MMSRHSCIEIEVLSPLCFLKHLKNGILFVHITHAFVLMNKVSARNSGYLKIPDTWYISAMDQSFGLKILVLKHLPLGYIHTKMS